jgi:hypothetical protein
MEVGIFVCSICGDPSQTICVYCTKDACGNHLCDRCHRCSDCCGCELALTQRDTVKHGSNNGHVTSDAPILEPVPEAHPAPEAHPDDEPEPPAPQAEAFDSGF